MHNLGRQLNIGAFIKYQPAFQIAFREENITLSQKSSNSYDTNAISHDKWDGNDFTIVSTVSFIFQFSIKSVYSFLSTPSTKKTKTSYDDDVFLNAYKTYANVVSNSVTTSLLTIVQKDVFL